MQLANDLFRVFTSLLRSKRELKYSFLHYSCLVLCKGHPSLRVHRAGLPLRVLRGSWWAAGVPCSWGFGGTRLCNWWPHLSFLVRTFVCWLNVLPGRQILGLLFPLESNFF